MARIDKQTENATEQRIFLRNDVTKADSISRQVQELCNIVNNTIIPSLRLLEMFDKSTLWKYVANSANAESDYKAKYLEGVKIGSGVRKLIEQQIESDIINAIGDGWGEQDTTLSKFCKWESDSEESEMIIPNSDTIKEYCNVYATGEEAVKFVAIQKVLDELTKVTDGKCGNLFAPSFPIACIDGKFVINGNINLKYFL